MWHFVEVLGDGGAMRKRIGSILFGFASLAALSAAAEDVVLRPHFTQGDSYALSLSAKTNAALVSRGGPASVDFAEDGELHYSATVVVLETDARGIPIRERHQGVELTSERPGQPGTLFLSGTFEVQRRDGDVRVFVAGERAERSVERVVARLLSNQLEFSVGALVDPGRPVAVGESWEIPVAQVRAYLRGQGLRDVKQGAPASATLTRDGGRLAVRYQIPIDSFRLRKMPANAHASRSEGRLEGTLQLGSQQRPVHHASTLALSLRGAVVKSGVSTSYPWSYQSTQALDQRTRRVEPELASAY
jgi:hypothetical protein